MRRMTILAVATMLAAAPAFAQNSPTAPLPATGCGRAGRAGKARAAGGGGKAGGRRLHAGVAFGGCIGVVA